MIPKPFIARWREHAPWTLLEHVEQDLVISRALVEIYSDDFLRTNLAFRGGTALHKLHTDPAPRYSEDLDFVQIKEGPIKPILTRIGAVIGFFDEKRIVKQKKNNNTIIYRFNSEYAPDIRLRLKIEINCREHFHIYDLQEIPFEVENGWFSGRALITSYHISELLATKLRALYQRKKGRDLFDLYYAHQQSAPDYEKIIHAYKAYMRFVVGNPPTQKQFLLNMQEKQHSEAFAGDLEGLLRPGIHYEQEDAFSWLFEEIVARI